MNCMERRAWDWRVVPVCLLSVSRSAVAPSNEVRTSPVLQSSLQSPVWGVRCEASLWPQSTTRHQQKNITSHSKGKPLLSLSDLLPQSLVWVLHRVISRGGRLSRPATLRWQIWSSLNINQDKSMAWTVGNNNSREGPGGVSSWVCVLQLKGVSISGVD